MAENKINYSDFIDPNVEKGLNDLVSQLNKVEATSQRIKSSIKVSGTGGSDKYVDNEKQISNTNSFLIYIISICSG